MDVKYNFDVEFMEEAKDFVDKLDTKAREKILYNIWKSRFSTDKNLFKKLNDDIWEFRTLFNKTYYRMFAFRDKDDKRKILVIATHGIVKKTDKTPEKEINRAVSLKNEYIISKRK
ncbi:MAG: type II toxin-antitoxin system RelE/ParE family toxin [Ignavibacteriaceae bacterium]|nr:type II toxin-antitoxin system RelE/ParE family toxin [Ignavibacteriaceae bacterium]